jgi:hypothetical protein
MPTHISPIRQPSGAEPGSSASDSFIDRPMSTTLLTVPSPGICRNGIQSSSTAAPTMITTVPISRPTCFAMPWCSTSHGSRPSRDRTCSAPASP